jgi:hypothetical protein
MVIDLQIQKCKLVDSFFKRYGHEIDEMEQAARLY